jgi:hypothetical protein
MLWTTPSFETIKMDAEIGSYQEDTDPERDTSTPAILGTLPGASAGPVQE